MKNFLKLTLLVALLATSLVLSACGSSSHEEGAAKEGVWVELNDVAYQVQISRQLNPADPEDGPYLQGIPKDQLDLPGNETYFAVFLKAQNTNSKSKMLASEFEIEDTQKAIYKPLPLAETNVFAYRPISIKGDGGVYPIPNSPAANGPTQGGIIVFKVTMASFQNRPLEFKIRQGGHQVATDLDV